MTVPTAMKNINVRALPVDKPEVPRHTNFTALHIGSGGIYASFGHVDPLMLEEAANMNEAVTVTANIFVQLGMSKETFEEMLVRFATLYMSAPISTPGWKERMIKLLEGPSDGGA